MSLAWEIGDLSGPLNSIIGQLQQFRLADLCITNPVEFN